jgi:hypothetical protein
MMLKKKIEYKQKNIKVELVFRNKIKEKSE